MDNPQTEESETLSPKMEGSSPTKEKGQERLPPFAGETDDEQPHLFLGGLEEPLLPQKSAEDPPAVACGWTANVGALFECCLGALRLC